MILLLITYHCLKGLISFVPHPWVCPLQLPDQFSWRWIYLALLSILRVTPRCLGQFQMSLSRRGLSLKVLFKPMNYWNNVVVFPSVYYRRPRLSPSPKSLRIFECPKAASFCVLYRECLSSDLTAGKNCVRSFYFRCFIHSNRENRHTWHVA